MPTSCLFSLRIDWLIQLTFADDGVRHRCDFATALDFDFLLLGFLDLGNAHDMFAIGNLEDRHTHGVSARDPDVSNGGADHLPLISDEHKLLTLPCGEACDNAAISL